MTRINLLSCLVSLVLVGGCPDTVREINPFRLLTETVGVPAGDAETEAQDAAQGFAVEAPFRRSLTVTFRNNHSTAELNTSFVAWVSVASITSAQQQDALFADGYVQLRRETRLGTAFALPVGTFVYNGGGTAGATAIVLEPALAGDGQTAVTPTTESITLITPDAVLVFAQPPVSCESVAFFYTVEGEPLTAVPVAGPSGPYGGSTTLGGFKTLAQVDVYQCDPLRPGLFLMQGGATRFTNEYLEGEDITFDFNEVDDGNGNFASVTIGAEE